MQLKLPVLNSLLLLLLSFCGNNDVWVYRIDGKSISRSEIENAYEAFYSVTRSQLEAVLGPVSDEQLQAWINDPRSTGNPQLAQAVASLDRKNFYEFYKEMMLVGIAARESGFVNDKKVQEKVKLNNAQFLSNLYLMEQARKHKAEVSEAEAIRYFEEVRKDPRFAKVPLDEGIARAKTQIAAEKGMQKQQEIRKQISEAHRVETNPDFQIPSSSSDQNATPGK